VAYRHQGRLHDAVIQINHGLGLKPSLWQGHLHLGIVLHELQRQEEALTSYEQAVNLNPNYAESHWRRGLTLTQLERWEQAIDSFRAALAIDQNLPEIRSNLGFALMKAQLLNEAIQQYQLALEMKETPALHFLMGTAYQNLGLRSQAIFSYKRAIALDPDYSSAQYRLSFLLLLEGDFEAGLKYFERRLTLPEDADWLEPVRKIISGFGMSRYWQGQAISGSRLTVITEQGLGDSLMMLRYLPLLKNATGISKLVVVCDAALESIIQNISGIDKLVVKPTDITDDQFDWYCTTMSLPFAFKTRLGNIPTSPYLQIPGPQRERFYDRLRALPGLKVGLAWAGNSRLDTDSIRSIPLMKLASLLSIEGITWVSLQKGNSSRQLRDIDVPVHDWMEECQTLEDTAALMEGLDLVITVDTSIVHLSGAIGRPTWLLNRYETEWRWLLEREDSPWYSSLRIFRQPIAKDWDSVITRVADELRLLVRA
jgi:tetratricopeptide (TPR) repeat protein